MKYTFLLLLIACLHKPSFAQSDTTYVYLNYDGITTKDSANRYIKFYKDGDIWYGKEYYANTGVLKSEGYYKELNYLKPVRTFKNYTSKGRLANSVVLNDSSRVLERTFYYRNGNKEAVVKYPKGGAGERVCWDTVGVETSPCEIKSEARFKGGMEGWRKFLERNLNANVAAQAGAPEGTYTVTAQFVVDKNGSLSHIRAVQVPQSCIPCGAEVLRMLSKSPAWEPAIVDGEAEEFIALQKVSFQIIEEEPRQKRRRN
jgi:hypothetical protein